MYSVLVHLLLLDQNVCRRSILIIIFGRKKEKRKKNKRKAFINSGLNASERKHTSDSNQWNAFFYVFFVKFFQRKKKVENEQKLRKDRREYGDSKWDRQQKITTFPGLHFTIPNGFFFAPEENDFFSFFSLNLLIQSNFDSISLCFTKNVKKAKIEKKKKEKKKTKSTKKGEKKHKISYSVQKYEKKKTSERITEKRIERKKTRKNVRHRKMMLNQVYQEERENTA